MNLIRTDTFSHLLLHSMTLRNSTEMAGMLYFMQTHLHYLALTPNLIWFQSYG